jgi:hypothetical protein
LDRASSHRPSNAVNIALKAYLRGQAIWPLAAIRLI